MSHVPTPSGIARPMSRLPTSTQVETSSLMKPPTVVTTGMSTKRPRGDSTDLEDGIDAKRPKDSKLQKSHTTLSKSMLHLANVGAKSKTLAKPGIVKKTALQSGRIAGTKPAVQSRAAMGDRTNVGRTISGSSISNGAASSTGSTDRKLAPASAAAAAVSRPAKRPPWDLKGKIEDMEVAFAATMQRVATLENQNNILQVDVEQKEVLVATNSEDLENARAECRRLKRDLEEKEDQLRQDRRQIEDLSFSKSALERRLRETEDEVSTKQAELTGLRTTVAELTSAAAGSDAKLKATQNELEKALDKINVLERVCADQKESIDVYQDKQRMYETERRKLHNTILELKGNIRVFCRVRPMIGSEIEKYNSEIKHIAVNGDKNLDIVRVNDSPAGSTAPGKVERHQFEFDHVFNAESSQENVFEEISQLIQSAIDGYNVCIFAYGQTGSGKTFTMEGGENDEEQGIIPRTINKIYEDTNSLIEKGWTYKMEASFLEIYNEEIRDLLATEKGLKYEIKKVDTKTNDIYVSNLKIEDVTHGETINSLLNRAKRNRIVAATNCNERSSRSHSVFILKITGQNSVTSEACTGTLNLVDLAGSERLKESGSTGLRLEETKNINSSLSNLSKVIMALASNKDGHIPYRDSKLTHLLMNSLGGNSKTLMFVNLSPREDYLNETLNSLRFAKRVNQCQIGTATKKVNAEIK